MSMRVKGVKNVMNNVRAVMNYKSKQSLKGVWNAAFFILREATTIAPKDLGNLRISGYLVSTEGHVFNPSPRFIHESPDSTHKADAKKMAGDHSKAISITAADGKKFKDFKTVAIGFSAFYAGVIHEDSSRSYKNGESKFLQKAIRRNQNKILQIIAKEVKK